MLGADSAYHICVCACMHRCAYTSMHIVHFHGTPGPSGKCGKEGSNYNKEEIRGK